MHASSHTPHPPPHRLPARRETPSHPPPTFSSHRLPRRLRTRPQTRYPRPPSLPSSRPSLPPSPVELAFSSRHNSRRPLPLTPLTSPPKHPRVTHPVSFLASHRLRALPSRVEGGVHTCRGARVPFGAIINFGSRPGLSMPVPHDQHCVFMLATKYIPDSPNLRTVTSTPSPFSVTAARVECKEKLPPVEDIISEFTKGNTPPSSNTHPLVVVQDPSLLKAPEQPEGPSQRPVAVMFDPFGENRSIADAVFAEIQIILGLALQAAQPSLSTEEVEESLPRLRTVLAPTYGCPRQDNDYDCGNLEEGLQAPLTYGAGQLRRNLRADVVLMATNLLIQALITERCVVPDQNPPLRNRVNSTLPPEFVELDNKLRDAVGEIHNTQCRLKCAEEETERVEGKVDAQARELMVVWAEIERLRALVGPAERTPALHSPTRGACFVAAIQRATPDEGGDAVSLRAADAVVRNLILNTQPLEQSLNGVAQAGQGPRPNLFVPAGAVSEVNSAAIAVHGRPRETQGESQGPEGSRVGFAGVHLGRDGLWVARLVTDPKAPTTIGLGSWDDQIAAAKAFAAAAYVVRRDKPVRGRVLPLLPEEQELLRGCTTQHVIALSRVRAWGSWTRWRQETEARGIVIAPPAAADSAPATAPTAADVIAAAGVDLHAQETHDSAPGGNAAGATATVGLPATNNGEAPRENALVVQSDTAS
ncbi:unnamed protein product [Closterium sp. Yama58-4]|nr:unnamed protein product [Closterium sp. Yama58-4]